MSKPAIQYNWGKENLHITFGNRLDKRIALLMIAELIFTFFVATMFLMQAFYFGTTVVSWVTGIFSSTLYLIATFRFINRISFREEWLVDTTGLTIIYKTISKKSTHYYPYSSIGNLHYCGKEPKTDHPLKGQSFDYFGLDSHEHLIQSLHQNGSLYFYFQDKRVYFGRGVFSWHAEELITMIQLYSGGKLKLGSEWEALLQEVEWENE